MYINKGTGVGKDEKHGVDFAHKKVFLFILIMKTVIKMNRRSFDNDDCENHGQDKKFLSDPGIPGSDLWVQVSLTHSPLVDLTDVTLVDEDTKSILADDTNRAIPGNWEMQVRQSYLVRKIYFVRKSCLLRKSYLVIKIYLVV